MGILGVLLLRTVLSEYCICNIACCFPLNSVTSPLDICRKIVCLDVFLVFAFFGSVWPNALLSEYWHSITVIHKHQPDS